MQPQERFEEHLRHFTTLSDQELVKCFNSEVGKYGWGTARASFLSALHHSLMQRSIDFSAIGDQNSLSFKSKVELVEARLIPLDEC
jgi:hypothetical protein